MIAALPETEPTVAERLSDARARIAAAARAVGRDPAGITLVAVGKRQPEARIEAALEAGHRAFGENYVQEGARRWQDRRTRIPDLELHLIGALQTNKAKDAVELFDVIHTLDRPKLAHALAAAIDRTGRRPRLLIQVNTGEEPQKAGVWPEDADGLIRLCLDELGLPVEGLMCMPPFDDDPAPHFALLATIARRNGLRYLSMGMSDDFELAVRLGATHVRIGSAVFGERPPGPKEA